MHDRVLDAAVRLFADRGILSTSMDAIAEEAGVSKATLYGHWTDKDALFLEALGRLYGLDEIPPDFDSGQLVTDLAAMLRYRPAAARFDEQKKVLPHLMAYASQHREFGTSWRRRVMTPARTRLAARLERAVTCGELPRDLHLETAIAELLGPMLYREITTESRAGSLEDLPERVADAFCRAHAVRGRKQTVRASGRVSVRSARPR